MSACKEDTIYQGSFRLVALPVEIRAFILRHLLDSVTITIKTRPDLTTEYRPSDPTSCELSSFRLPYSVASFHRIVSH